MMPSHVDRPMNEDQDPITRFAGIYEEAEKHFPYDASACTLATTNAAGKPSARVVLLKGFDEHGFVFYTNLESRKGKDLREAPYACLCFYWSPLNQQIRVEGPARQVTDSEADAYFATRPRGAQVGAWASRQSATLEDRHRLESQVKAFEEKFQGNTVPRPPFWSGYRVNPDRMEFWVAREDRLHDRTLYTREGEAWKVLRLYP